VLNLPEQARHHHSDGRLRSVWVGVPGGFLAVEEGTPRNAVIALRIGRTERAAWLERFERENVAIDKQSRWTVYVRDPEGNVVGLSHHPEDPMGV
jgi:hypothetical protein